MTFIIYSLRFEIIKQTPLLLGHIVSWKYFKSLIKIRKSGLNTEFCNMQLDTAGLLVIQNRKLLLAFTNKQCFDLPGGKIDKGETAIMALCREIKEKLNILLKDDELGFYTHISAPAYGEKKRCNHGTGLFSGQ